jgi:translation elongation factor EF-1alpha
MATNKPIGTVTHYFPHVEVAIVKLGNDLKVGDNVKFMKNDEEFDQEITSMQMDHNDIKAGKKGQEVGVKVTKKVKEGWLVYKI